MSVPPGGADVKAFNAIALPADPQGRRRDFLHAQALRVRRPDDLVHRALDRQLRRRIGLPRVGRQTLVLVSLQSDLFSCEEWMSFATARRALSHDRQRQTVRTEVAF